MFAGKLHYNSEFMLQIRYVNINHSNCLFSSIQIAMYLFTKTIIPLSRFHIKSSKRSYQHRLLRWSSFILLNSWFSQKRKWVGKRKKTPIIIGKVIVKDSIWKPKPHPVHRSITFLFTSLIYFFTLSQFSYNHSNHGIENRHFQLFNSIKKIATSSMKDLLYK